MRLLFCFLLTAFCIGSNSCQKEFSTDTGDSAAITPPRTTDPNLSGDFTAKINGVDFSANKASGANISNEVIVIIGQDNSGQTIILRVADSSVHVYTMDINSDANVGAYTKDSAFAYTTNQGNSDAESGGILSITEIDTTNKTISGTFNLKLYRAFDLQQLKVMEGVFTNIPYTTEALPPANANDTFRVKVDGVDFPTYSVSSNTIFESIFISASDQSLQNTVGLTFPKVVTPGAYDLTYLDFSFNGQYNKGDTYTTAESGSITIIENDQANKRVRGTFSFHAIDLLGTAAAELTEGYFSLKY